MKPTWVKITKMKMMFMINLICRIWLIYFLKSLSIGPNKIWISCFRTCQAFSLYKMMSAKWKICLLRVKELCVNKWNISLTKQVKPFLDTEILAQVFTSYFKVKWASSYPKENRQLFHVANQLNKAQEKAVFLLLELKNLTNRNFRLKKNKSRMNSKIKKLWVF